MNFFGFDGNLYGWITLAIFIISVFFGLTALINVRGKQVYNLKNPIKTSMKLLFVGLFALLAFMLPIFIDFTFWTIILFVYTFMLAMFAIEISSMAGMNDKDKKLHQILGMIAVSEKITNNDVEKLLGVSDATATRYLDELEKQGLIKQMGKTGKDVYYEKRSDKQL